MNFCECGSYILNITEPTIKNKSIYSCNFDLYDGEYKIKFNYIEYTTKSNHSCNFCKWYNTEIRQLNNLKNKIIQLNKLYKMDCKRYKIFQNDFNKIVEDIDSDLPDHKIKRLKVSDTNSNKKFIVENPVKITIEKPIDIVIENPQLVIVECNDEYDFKSPEIIILEKMDNLFEQNIQKLNNAIQIRLFGKIRWN